MFCSQETKEEKSSYTCPLCEKICTTQHQLTMHIRQVRRVLAPDVLLLLRVSAFPRCIFQRWKTIPCANQKCFRSKFIQLFCFYFSLLLVFSFKTPQTQPGLGNFPPFFPQHSSPHRSGSNKDVCPVLHSLKYPKDPASHFHHEAQVLFEYRSFHWVCKFRSRKTQFLNHLGAEEALSLSQGIIILVGRIKNRLF